jgi:hypothetical protein
MSQTGILLHVASLRGLPVPVALFLYAAANVVVLSFVPAALFSGERPRGAGPAGAAAPASGPAAMVRTPAVRALGAALAVAALGASLVSPQGWLWVVLGVALVGDVWALLNPWAAAHDVLAAWPLGGRVPGRPRLRLPDRLGTWPAVAVCAGVAAVALAPGPFHPRWLVAGLAAAYAAATLAGTALFGRDEWLGRCEAVTAVLDVAGRFGPVAVVRGADGRPERLRLRPWGAGLVEGRGRGWDRVALVVLLLGGMALAGLLGTGPWRTFAGAVAALPAGSALAGLLGLALLTAAFLGVFAAFARLALALSGGAADDAAATAGLALTLVPIALLCGAALSAGALLVQAQPALPAWALARPDAVWYLQVTLVVIGHAIAVHLAHRHASAHFRGARRALLAEYPMVVLLVIATMTGMWILAQPLV